MTKILGISAFYHDSAAAIIEDGKIVAAAQEERFTRKKHDSSYPFHAIEFVLNYSKTKLSEVNNVVFFEKPFLKFERLLETYVAMAPRGFLQFSKAMPAWLREKLFQKKMLFDLLKQHDKNFVDSKKIFFSEHHLSHAASAFFPSPFKEALILTADGVGEWATTSVAIGKSNDIQIKKEINFPHSLGLLYSAFTYYCGFKVNSGEYKLMGLAPFGKPIYSDLIKNKIVDIKKDGSFRLDQKFFNYSTGFEMINFKFEKLFGKARRKPESEIDLFFMNIAASIQKVTQDILLKILLSLKKEFKEDNLCMAGGVALNCVANGLINKKKIFKEIWVQPAAGDAGGALGAILAFWHMHLKKKRIIKGPDSMNGSYLGPRFHERVIKKELNRIGAKFKLLDEKTIIKKTAKFLSLGKAVGWFQGRMEFGPRALGSRSILADPRNKNMQKQLNLKIKFRESFRPFAPSILKEHCKKWFELDCSSPYMLLVSKVKKKKLIRSNQKQINLSSINNLRSIIPSVTHIDNTARIQTVDVKTSPKYYKLINEFYKLTNTPILINTSFNIRGEPIVCSPENAFKCFMGTNLDILIIENFILEKGEQNKEYIIDYTSQFGLD